MNVQTLDPQLLIPRYLVHSFVYYQSGNELIPNSDYDALAKRIFNEWDNLTHVHKHLIDRNLLTSGGHYLKYNKQIEGAAYHLLRGKYPPNITETDMAKINSRSKGQRGEREVVKILQAAADEVYGYFNEEPPFFERNQMQSNNGGYDIIGLDWLAPEVKHCETLQLEKWWKQTLRQCGKNQTPVLFYRKSHVKWRVRMFGYFIIDKTTRRKYVADISLDDFSEWFKFKMSATLGK